MSTVLVTGATDGLGRALATRLAGEGATVLAHARSEERGREALAELLDGAGDVRLVVGDLASLSAVRALADQVPDRLDVLVLEDGYDGARAYRQSKLAQIMHAFDMAEELQGRGVTATALHPATFMDTKMVIDAGVTPASTVQEGLEATWRLVADPSVEGVSGAYFNGTREVRADAQAYDLDARRRLRELSQRLVEV